MMGTFKPLDYHRWAEALDIVSWDSYPARNSPPVDAAFKHALLRGMKGGQPFMLMEQTPSSQNWQAYNSLKRPGVMRLWSYQAMAHGADSVMYFQWRRSPGAQEMFHGAVVEHAGRSDVRVFREVAALGAELKKLGTKTLGAPVASDVAVLFSWENWWAVEYSSGPSVALEYVPACMDVFESLSRLGINTDVVSPEADWSKHKVVIAPVLKMVKPGFAEKVRRFVEGGGVFLTTYFSGVVDETDRAFTNGYPGPLAPILGIWVEEMDTLPPSEFNSARYKGRSFPCNLLFDLIRLEGAEALAVYEKDFYAGKPVITRHSVGSGQAYYVGSNLNAEGWDVLLGDITGEVGIPARRPPTGVEVVRRGNIDYWLNHNAAEVTVTLSEGRFVDLLTDSVYEGTLKLPGYGVALLQVPNV
jgi:beta-galactosidase